MILQLNKMTTAEKIRGKNGHKNAKMGVKKWEKTKKWEKNGGQVLFLAF